MEKRSIGTMILLTIVTLGIYMIIWECLFQADLKEQTGEGFGPVAHFFMSVFTFGIYTIYWQYAAGKRLAKLKAEDNSVLYVILALLGVGFINMFMMQNQANKLN